MDLRKAIGQPMKADRLLMALVTDDVMDAINIPLRARRGTFAIDYSDHIPLLYVYAKGIPPQVWMACNTRARQTNVHKMISPDLGLMVNDMVERLARLNAKLCFSPCRDKQNRRMVKLQVISADSRNIAITLATVLRGHKRAHIGPFNVQG